MPSPHPSEKSLFETARHIADPHERASYLRTACRDNPALRSQVELLLSLQAEADHRFEPPSHDLPRAITDALTTDPGTGDTTAAPETK